MHREEHVRLLLSPALDSLRALIDMFRSLPWPEPVQRLGQRGLQRLTARFPELSELITGKPSPVTRAPRDAARGQSAEPVALDALLSDIKARDYETRARAARDLAQYRTPETVSTLIGLLRDRSVEVAVAAATALSMVGDAAARTGLLAVLQNFEGFYHPLTRAAAVRGLGSLLLGDQRAPLHHALRDLDAEVSIAAIAALSAQSSAESSAALLRVVENADGFFLPISRLAAARALERLPPCATGELEALRSREPDVLVGEALTRLIDGARASSLHA